MNDLVKTFAAREGILYSQAKKELCDLLNNDYEQDVPEFLYEIGMEPDYFLDALDLLD